MLYGEIIVRSQDQGRRSGLDFKFKHRVDMVLEVPQLTND